MTPDWLIDLKSLPTPEFGPVNAKKQGYRSQTPIAHDGSEASEACVELKSYAVAGDNHYATASNPPYFQSVPGSVDELWLREKVAQKLVTINERIASAGLELYVFDAWRPQAIQIHFHDIWFPQWLRDNRPQLSEDEIADEVERYWAAPSDGTASPSPHSTGAAVDLTLRFTATKQPLYMGGIFDDLTENAHTDWFERTAPQSMSEEEARANRRLLFWLMHDAGFANNPTEWWHYSYGDQMWARLYDKPVALYPACDPRGGK